MQDPHQSIQRIATATELALNGSIIVLPVIGPVTWVIITGFVMYLADAFGYLGSVGVLLYKEFAQPNVSWMEFFTTTCFIVSIAGVMLSAAALIYFDRKFNYKLTPQLS